MSGQSRAVNPQTKMPVDITHGSRNPDLPPAKLQPDSRGHENGGPFTRFMGNHPAIAGCFFAAGVVLITKKARDGESGLPGFHGGYWTLALILLPTLCLIVCVLALPAMVGLYARDRYEEWFKNETRRLAPGNAQAMARWSSTRPLSRVATSSDPRGTLAQIMQEYNASLLLGIVPDTQLLATAGRTASVLIIAPSQSGKTTTLAAPMVLAHYGPAVITSTKDDLVNFTVRERASRGTVWIYDPANEWAERMPPGALRAYWTPLWSAKTWDDAIETAATMVKATSVASGTEPHWSDTAAQLLAPCLLAAALHQDTTIIDVTEWIYQRYLTPPQQILALVADDPTHPLCVDADRALFELNSMLEIRGEQRDSIFSVTTRVLKAYNTKAVYLSGGHQNFDPNKFVRSFDTLYIASPSRHQETFAPLVVALIDAVQQAGYDFNRESPFHSSSRPSVLMCLDEAANISPMRELPRYLSEAGGQGVQMVVVLQSMGQVAKVWPAEAKSFMDPFATIIAFGGLSDRDTLDSLSTLVGDYDRNYVSNTFSESTSQALSKSRSTTTFLNPVTKTTGVTTGTATSSGQTTSVRKERRLTPADIAGIAPRHALAISKHDQPDRRFAVIEMTPVYESPWTQITSLAPPALQLAGTFKSLEHDLPILPPQNQIY